MRINSKKSSDSHRQPRPHYNIRVHTTRTACHPSNDERIRGSWKSTGSQGEEKKQELYIILVQPHQINVFPPLRSVRWNKKKNVSTLTILFLFEQALT